MHLPPPIALYAALALALAGCDERAAASPADAAPPPAPPASAPSAVIDGGIDGGADGGSASRPPPSGSAAAENPSLQLLKLVFTSEVKNKEPVDKLDRALPGQRVWVHLTLRNRGAEARPITLAFRVNGESRSKVDLKVEPSWSYRTWGYNTLRAGDQTGELVAEVRDDGGALLTTARLPIGNAGKPPPPKPEPLDP